METADIKYYRIPISDHRLNRDSERLGLQIYEKGDHDSIFVGIVRGGMGVAPYVTGAIEKKWKKPPLFSVTMESYNNKNEQTKVTRLDFIDELVRVHLAESDKQVIPIDDVWDTGWSGHILRTAVTQGLRIDDGSIIREVNGMYICEYKIKLGQQERTVIVPLYGDLERVREDKDVKMAVTYFKRHADQTGRRPYYLIEEFHINEKGEWPWVVFPWEKEYGLLAAASSEVLQAKQ